MATSAVKKSIKIRSLALIVCCLAIIAFAGSVAAQIDVASLPFSQRLPMDAGAKIERNLKYVADSGEFYMIFQDDGNLVVYDKNDRFVWGVNLVTKDFGRAAKVEFRKDGSFGLYDAQGKTVWSPTNNSVPAMFLFISPKGVLTLLADGGRIVWASDGSGTAETIDPSNYIPVEGYTGPTTKRELTITLPFAKSQKMTVEIAEDGTVIFQRDMILGNISEFARIDSPSFDAYARMQSNPFIPNFVKAGFKASDFKGSAGSKSAANSGIWANSTIPYVLPASHGKRDIILAGINEINSKTNLCLVPRTNQIDYVEFISEDGFWATLGRVGGRQEISIDQTKSYVPMGTVAHEILHAAGFNHMQSREDRDGFVTINFGNIQRGMENNFERLRDKATNVGPYDFTSVMHYYAKAFSINGQNTIDVKGGGDTSKMGQRDSVSAGDIAAVATKYAPGSCKPGVTKPPITTPTPTTTPTPAPTPTPKPTPTTTTDNTGNIAIGKKAYQGGDDLVKQSGDAGKAIDGNTDGRFDMGSVTQTGEGKYLFWEVDLGADYYVDKIVIWNRTDECCWNRQQNFEVSTTDEVNGIKTNVTPDRVYYTNFSYEGKSDSGILIQKGNFGPFSFRTANDTNMTIPINRFVRWIRISRASPEGKTLPGLSFAEVQVFGKPPKYIRNNRVRP